MAKLIFALILFALGVGASRALVSMAAAPSGPWQRAAPHLRLASRVVLAIGVQRHNHLGAEFLCRRKPRPNRCAQATVNHMTHHKRALGTRDFSRPVVAAVVYDNHTIHKRTDVCEHIGNRCCLIVSRDEREGLHRLERSNLLAFMYSIV